MTRVAAYAALQEVAGAPAAEAEAIVAAVCAQAARDDAICGLIVVLPDGRPVLAHQSPHMIWAIATDACVQAGASLRPEVRGEYKAGGAVVDHRAVVGRRARRPRRW